MGIEETQNDTGASPNNRIMLRNLPPGTPKWLLISCCVVGSVIVPSFMAFSPQLSELIKGATEVRKAQAENERTALGTVLDLVNTNTKQVYVLSAALEAEQREKKLLNERVTELEKSDLLHGKALEDCTMQLALCKK